MLLLITPGVGLNVIRIRLKRLLVWPMVSVNYSPLQGDAHVIQTKTVKNILIDTGYLEPSKNTLIPLLHSKGIKKLDAIFISHPHKDHYAGG